MTPTRLYSATGVVLFCIGLLGVTGGRHLVRRIMALNIMGGGVFLLLISVARRDAEQWPDPVPHALVLTGIVVAVSASALALAIARKITALTGKTDLDESPKE